MVKGPEQLAGPKQERSGCWGAFLISLAQRGPGGSTAASDHPQVPDPPKVVHEETDT